MHGTDGASTLPLHGDGKQRTAFMMAASAAMGFLCLIMRAKTSTMTMFRASPTSSRMQMVLSESMVVLRKLMLSGLMPNPGSCEAEDGTKKGEKKNHNCKKTIEKQPRPHEARKPALHRAHCATVGTLPRKIAT